METNIVSHFGSLKVGQMELTHRVQVESGTTVRRVVELMAAASQSSAVITESGKIIGIFTERDIARQVACSPDRWDVEIDLFMTPHPIVISPDTTAMEALHISNENLIRNLPVVGDDGKYFGTVTLFDLIRLASAYLRSHLELGNEISPEYSLHYVDLSGLQAHEALKIEAGGTLFEAIQMMIDANTGLVSVVDERGALIGELTEHDVFTKIACQVVDLNDELVGDWLTTAVASAMPSTSVADGLHVMSGIGHRYLVLVNENNHVLGMLNFRDIADYFETALEVV